MTLITEAQARKTAKYWANTIRNRTKSDNGEPLQTAMKAMLDEYLELPSEQSLLLFEEKLMLSIIEQQPYAVMTDYNPDKLLSEACSAFNIDPSLLPWKTVTWPSDETVRAGYGAKIVSY